MTDTNTNADFLPDPYKGQRERGYRLRAKLSKAFSKVTWTYAFNSKQFSHVFTAAFDLMGDEMATFDVSLSDEMIQRISFEDELVVYVARSMAHGIAEHLLEGAVRWKEGA